MSLAHRLFSQSVRDMRTSSAADVESAAGPLLSRLLDHAARHVPFYQSFKAELAAAAEDREAWASLPVLTLDRRRAADDTLDAGVLPPQDVQLDEKSWTTLSTPIGGRSSLLADVADRAQWEYLARRFGIDTLGRLAAILPPESILSGDLAEPSGLWSLDALGGQCHRWSEEFAPEATLLWLSHIRPKCLFLRPAMLESLLDAAGSTPPRVAHLLLTGPARRPETRGRCASVFGGRLVEAVTSDATGFVAGAEPSGLFVPATETNVVEILDAVGKPTGPGEPGSLVATALYHYRRVAIRCDLGVTAEWLDERAQCGRRCFRILSAA